eukprot:2273337-Rhodomonas_salina.1
MPRLTSKKFAVDGPSSKGGTSAWRCGNRDKQRGDVTVVTRSSWWMVAIVFHPSCKQVLTITSAIAAPEIVVLERNGYVNLSLSPGAVAPKEITGVCVIPATNATAPDSSDSIGPTIMCVLSLVVMSFAFAMAVDAIPLVSPMKYEREKSSGKLAASWEISVVRSLMC